MSADIPIQEFKFKKSAVIKFYLGAFMGIISIFLYLSIKHSVFTLLIGTSIFLLIMLYLFLYNKTIIVDTSSRKIFCTTDILGIITSKNTASIPQGATLHLYDKYQTAQRGAACWLHADIKDNQGVNVLPLNLQKRLSESSPYNRKILLNIVKFISRNMNLPIDDKRSVRYRD